MSSNEQVPDPEVPAKARSRTYSATYKARILDEYESLDKAGKGALLRREGLYTSLISAGASASAAAAGAEPAGAGHGALAAQLRRPGPEGWSPPRLWTRQTMSGQAVGLQNHF
jgi:transposase